LEAPTGGGTGFATPGRAGDIYSCKLTDAAILSMMSGGFLQSAARCHSHAAPHPDRFERARPITKRARSPLITVSGSMNSPVVGKTDETVRRHQMVTLCDYRMFLLIVQLP